MMVWFGLLLIVLGIVVACIALARGATKPDAMAVDASALGLLMIVVGGCLFVIAMLIAEGGPAAIQELLP